MSLNCSAEVNRIDWNTVSIKYIVGGWLTLLFCVFGEENNDEQDEDVSFFSSGIITNIFTVIVLIHPRMRNSSTHVYLMALSACNIFLSAGLMINYSLKSIGKKTLSSSETIVDAFHSITVIASYPELLAYLHRPDIINRNALLANEYEQFYAHVAPITTPLLSMLLLCSTYLTVLVSGDRYFLICWPSVAEKIRTRNVALRLVLVVFVLVNIYIFPHWFEYRTTTRVINTTSLVVANGTDDSIQNISSSFTQRKLVELTYTQVGSNVIYRSIYRFYLNVPITFVIPFTLLTLCNGSMIHKLLLIRQQKKRLGRRMRADIRITTMLIVIVLTFMLCRSINLFVNMLVQLSPCLNKNSLQRVNTFANLLIAFNGFVNFFLFAAFGQRFREMVFYIFFRRGQYPFFSHLDGTSAHRPGVSVTTPNSELLRKQSRRFSTNDSDLWTAISRRRSSATMAVLCNVSDNRPRSASHSITNSPRLCIPNYTNGNNHDHSNSSIDVAESSNPESSYQELQSNYRPRSNTLTVPGEQPLKSPSPSCIKKRADDLTPTMTHHVKFVWLQRWSSRIFCPVKIHQRSGWFEMTLVFSLPSTLSKWNQVHSRLASMRKNVQIIRKRRQRLFLALVGAKSNQFTCSVVHSNRFHHGHMSNSVAGVSFFDSVS